MNDLVSIAAAQHSVLRTGSGSSVKHDTPVMQKCTRRVGVGAFSGSLRGLELVPAKWRCLVPGERRDGAQSRPPALTANAHRWAASIGVLINAEEQFGIQTQRTIIRFSF